MIRVIGFRQGLIDRIEQLNENVLFKIHVRLVVSKVNTLKLQPFKFRAFEPPLT